METLDTLITYAYDLTLGGGALYIGTSLIVYLVDRWNKLEVKSKVAAPQTINLPLTLKARETEAISLESKQQDVQALEAAPVAETHEVQAETFSAKPPMEPQTLEPDLEKVEDEA